MTCHVDKSKAVHTGGDNSGDIFNTMNSELSAALKERIRSCCRLFLQDISSCKIQNASKSSGGFRIMTKTSASTKTSELLMDLSMQC